ncbi:MAG TPA: tetratricopeptide repeat protein [Longilinea sp.]|nr:tetratricopeptide repeat protein [Longilinea sp.]
MDRRHLEVVGIIVVAVAVVLLTGITPRAQAQETHLQAARVALSVKQPLRAADELLLAVQWEPWRSDLWEQIGQNEMDGGQADKAVEVFQWADAIGGLSPQGQFELGQAYLTLGNTAQAKETWHKLSVRSGLPASLFSELALAQRHQGDWDGLIDTLLAWYKQFPADKDIAYELGVVLAGQSPQEAIKYLDQVNTLPASRYDLVQDLKAVILNPATNESGQWIFIGQVLGKLNEWDLAAHAFDRATQADANNADAWALLGEALQQSGEPGYSALSHAQSLNPQSDIVRAALAQYWRRQNRPDVALVYLAAIAADMPDDPSWQLEMGDVSLDAGDINSALQYYQKAANLSGSDDPTYWRDLAEFCVFNNIQITETGLPAARQAILIDPKGAASLDTMGLVLYALQDYDNAEKFLLEAIAADNGYASAYLHLGQLYLEQNLPQQAESSLSKAQLLDPNGQVGEMAGRLLQRYFNGNN